MAEPLRVRLARLLAGGDWPSGSLTGASVQGFSEKWVDSVAKRFRSVSSSRVSAYADFVRMDETVEEIATALDLISQDATAGVEGSNESFSIAFKRGGSDAIKTLVTDVITRTQWYRKGYEIARETMSMGDSFRHYVVDRDNDIVYMMYLPPETMIRNEDEHGFLLDGNRPGEFGFEQVDASTSNVVAGFAPWKIQHLRWNKSGRRRYGRSILYTARTSWRKMQIMEEALTINWVTRAFARLLFILDVTGKSPVEAEKALMDFKASLQTRRIAKDQDNVEQLSVVKDIFMGRSYHSIGNNPVESLADVKVLDTSSSAYVNITPIDYFRSKMLMAVRCPRAYLGLEDQINAKATLTQEDRRFSRFLLVVQDVLSQGIRQTIDTQLALKNIDPRSVEYTINWPPPVWLDRVEDAAALQGYAQADQVYGAMGIIDKEWIAKRHLRMSQAEWEQVSARVEANPDELVPPAPTGAGSDTQDDKEADDKGD